VKGSEKLELENALMKPLTVGIIGALVVAVAVFGYLYCQRTRNDITIQLPKVMATGRTERRHNQWRRSRRSSITNFQ
jgi:hypothetical protein